MNRSCLRGRRGAFTLEAALTVPICLAILIFLMSTLMAIQSEVRLKAAADKTAAEISLVLPVIFSLMDEENLAIPVASLLDRAGKILWDGENPLSGGMLSHVLDFLDPQELESIVNDAALDLTSSIALGNLVTARIHYWLERSGSARSVIEPSVFLDWDLDNDRLYLEIFYSLRILAGPVERRATAFVPVWRPTADRSVSEAGTSVWTMGNFARGQALRERFGGNLPASYPVIARFVDGEATSIKSVDLNKPTYDDPAALYGKIADQITTLSRFNGTEKPFGKDRVWITASQIRERRLLLVVPADSDLRRFREALASLNALARREGVVFETVTYQKSKS